MSKRWIAICGALALPLLLTGCGATAGFLRDSMTQTQVQTTGFRIVTTGLASTVSSGSALCMIPVGDGDLYRLAMEDLNAQAKLVPNQMLVNIREDRKTISYVGFYCQYTLTLSADVIEFYDSGASAAPVAVAPVQEAPVVAAPPPPAEEGVPAAQPAAAAARPATSAARPSAAGRRPGVPAAAQPAR